MACPLPRFFSCFNTTTSRSDSISARFASVLPSSTTTTCDRLLRQAATTCCTVVLLLNTGTAHHTASITRESLFCICFPFSGSSTGNQHIPQWAGIAKFVKHLETSFHRIGWEHTVTHTGKCISQGCLQPCTVQSG